MPTYSAPDLIRKPIHLGEFGDATLPHGEVTPSVAPVTSDILRLCVIPAGFRMYALLLAWASQGGTAPADWGFSPVSSNDGALAANLTYFTSALAMATANNGTILARFAEIKFEQDVFLTATFGTVATGAIGLVTATCMGVSEGVR